MFYQVLTIYKHATFPLPCLTARGMSESGVRRTASETPCFKGNHKKLAQKREFYIIFMANPGVLILSPPPNIIETGIGREDV